MGDPLDERTTDGPADLRRPPRGGRPRSCDDGERVAIRGGAPDGPGLLDGAGDPRARWTPGARAAREEIFGPIACVIPFDDEDDAIRLANDTIYGLSGSIWTRDGARALRVARAIETGVLSINSNTSVRVVHAVRRLQAVGRRARARAPRARALLRGQDGLLRDGGLTCGSRARCASSPARRAASAPRRPGCSPSEGASVAGVDLRPGSPGDLSLAVDVTEEGAVQAMYERGAQPLRPHRRPLQQRRDLARRRRLRARHDATRPGSACRTSTSSRCSCAASTASRTCWTTTGPTAAASSTPRRSSP